MTITDEMVERLARHIGEAILSVAWDDLPEASCRLHGSEPVVLDHAARRVFQGGRDDLRVMARAALTAALEAQPLTTKAVVSHETAEVRDNIDDLAQEIRRVDGSHSLGAGALAEALMPWVARIRAEAVAEERERCARVAVERSASWGQWTSATAAGDDIAAAIRGGADTERYRHRQRGTTYRLAGRARVQTDAPLFDMDEVTVYQCEQTGDLWARRRSEFEDDRFERIDTK